MKKRKENAKMIKIGFLSNAFCFVFFFYVYAELKEMLVHFEWNYEILMLLD